MSASVYGGLPNDGISSLLLQLKMSLYDNVNFKKFEVANSKMYRYGRTVNSLREKNKTRE